MRLLTRWAVPCLCLLLLFGAGTEPRKLDAQSDEIVAAEWFGGIEAHDAPQRASELGISWSRARFHWGSIQPSGPNDWIDAELTDDELRGELAAGREVIGLLIGIPNWAQDETGLPSGLDSSIDDDDNLWAEFVRTVVSRYDGQIDHWIIWNEPDIWDSQHPAYSWPGSEVDFARLMKVSYLVIKETNSDAVVHLGAMSHFWDVLYDRELYFRRLLEVLSADPEAEEHNYYYDVATLHLYFNPADIYDILTEYQQIQSEFGIDKPFWLIETNAPPSTDPAFMVENPTFQVSLVEQAAFMPQAITLALAAGAERVGLYKMVDTPGDYAANPELFGLLRADGEPRPGLYTARATAQLFGPVETIGWVDTHLVSQVVTLGPDTVIRALWVRVPFSQTVYLPSWSGNAELVDMWGNRSHLGTEGGHYKLRLPAGECTQTVGDYCMIGGPPQFVIETREAAANENLSLELKVVEEEVGRDFSDVAPKSPLAFTAIISVVVAVTIMFGVVWLSHRLRLQFT